MGLGLSPEAVANLAERTEGWIAGLQLAALLLKGRPDPMMVVEAFTGSNRYLVDYQFEEVLRLVAVGLSNAEIATQLFLSVGTVKQHVHRLYGKLETTRRTSAVTRARALGLL
jgi:ATP/maltotriose-dependent transcriptional regulator MalT